MKVLTEHFSDNVRQALGDPHIQDAFEQATGRFKTSRLSAFNAFPEGESLRDLAREIKAHTIGQLDRYLEQLSDAVTALGGQVHWASDATDACRIITDLARLHGTKSVVKSKSMTTEEIGLNDALEKESLETVETDLGEYILQLAGETPAHIIAPAIHKTRQDVTELFTEKLGSPRLERHEDLTLEARKHLRDVFHRADMGISGVNFAVAETGSIVIVENEGNARLSTSLPPVHVAVMGMEKIVPSLSDLSVFLKILARSATGQKMSSYVSMITGPRRQGEEDGPEHFHLIVLDNGRSKLLADPVLRESLYCIRCGACLNVCPIYRHAGGHSYGWVYSGPIGAVITPSLVGHGQASDLPFASSLCGACREVCPVRIDLPKLLLEQREKVVNASIHRRPPEGPGRFGESRLIQLYTFIMASAWRYRWALRLFSWGSRCFRRQGTWWRPPGLSGWTHSRDFPLPARRTFRQRWREGAP